MNQTASALSREALNLSKTTAYSILTSGVTGEEVGRRLALHPIKSETLPSLMKIERIFAA